MNTKQNPPPKKKLRRYKGTYSRNSYILRALIIKEEVMDIHCTERVCSTGTGLKNVGYCMGSNLGFITYLAV